MIEVIVFVTSIITILICFMHKSIYNYWFKKQVNGPKPLPIFGNYASVFFGYKTEAELLREIYENNTGDYVGIYKGLKPVLLIRNPAMVKQILFKDFDTFNSRCIEKPISMYSRSLYVINGDEKWKSLRKIFAPGMVSDRIEKMIPHIQNSIVTYMKYTENVTNNHRYFEMRSLQNKYILHVFSKLIFNKEHDILDPDNFESAVTDFIASKLRLSFSYVAEFLCPPIASLVTNVQNSLNDNNNIFKCYVKSIIREVESRGAKRNNFLEFMISMKDTGKTRKDKDLPVNLNNDFIIQQSLTFFLTAFESTSSLQAFVVYELAHNAAVQDKCLKEINEVFDKYGDEITLDILSQMTYLQQVINEAMRIHAIQVIDRKCMINYKFPGKNLTIDKNLFVYVPVHGLHNDPKHFANPELFNPERFSAENREEIPQCAYLPFGDGPRMCIGHRIAKVVMLIGLSAFLRTFKVSPKINANSKPKYDPRRTRTLTPLGGLWVKVEKRKTPP